jgi:AraC-like DNA-binding protein
MSSRSESELLGQLLEKVSRRFADAGGMDDLSTALPWLGLIRRRGPTAIGRGMLEPSMCLMLQGEKQMLVGERVLRYGAGCYVQAGTTIPVSGQVVRASEAEPYYGIRVDLDPRELASFMLEMRVAMPSSWGDDPPLVSVEIASKALLEAFERVLGLLDRPSDLPVLGRLLKQEIVYYLVTGPGGATLTQGLMGSHRESAVNKAISWIREHYDAPLKIAELAEAVHLSPSVLHRRFKAATIMSPLQYQKQVRLLEARKLLMSGGVEAANVAFQVGYESPSQFSREYRRLFGASPLQDAEQLRGVAPSP